MLNKALIAAALAMSSAVALAHHGWSSYDSGKTITHKATLTNLNWANPHGIARVVYQRAQWNVILAPIARMESRGLTPKVLRRQVTLIGHPRRDGTREMRIERIIAGNRTFEMR